MSDVERQIGQRRTLGSVTLALLVTASAFGATMAVTKPPLSVKPSSSVVQLTSGPSEHIEPVFSPDGKTLAFSSNQAGSYDIWLVRPDGRKLTMLTSLPGDEVTPKWNPNGSSIAFLWEHGLYSDLCVSSTAKDASECLTDGSHVRSFAWSHDGLAIAYDAGNGTIRLLNMMNGLDTPFLFDGYVRDPTFGPSPGVLYFSIRTGAGDYIWNASLDGSNGRQLSWEGTDVEPEVSPSGNYLMYLTNLSGRYEPWLIDLATGVNSYLFNRPDLAPAYIFPASPQLASGSIPSWGPSGANMLFVSSDNHTQGNLYLVTMDVSVDLNQQNSGPVLGFIVPVYDLNIYNRVPVPGLVNGAQWGPSGNVVIQASMSGFEQLTLLQNGPPVRVGYGG